MYTILLPTIKPFSQSSRSKATHQILASSATGIGALIFGRVAYSKRIQTAFKYSVSGQLAAIG
jgi:hypothetical protein